MLGTEEYVRDAVAAMDRASQMIVSCVKRTQMMIDSTTDLPDLIRSQVDRMSDLSQAIQETQQALSRRGLSDEQLMRRLEPIFARTVEAVERARDLNVRLDHIDDRLGTQELGLNRRLTDLTTEVTDLHNSQRRTRRRLFVMMILVILFSLLAAAAPVLMRMLKWPA